MIRRRFVFWVGMGLFGLAEKLRADGLDSLAAAMMRSTERDPETPGNSKTNPEHWTAAGNRTWQWYEREALVDGQWKVTGITTPVNRKTGERYVGRSGYLDESLVPRGVRRSTDADVRYAKEYYAESYEDAPEVADDDDPSKPDAARRNRHGRPPSKWLRSLHADELRIWLKTIDPPEAGVSGMTFWTHLTRDHSFDPRKIVGLNIDEQAKLHAAAHYGY